MADTLVYCEHESTTERYVNSYYDDSSLRGHRFHEPVPVPNTNMTVHVWSVPTFVPLRKGLETLIIAYYFSIYENGLIINPENDPRFKKEYDAHVAEHKRPWVECYFMNMEEISLFFEPIIEANKPDKI